MTDWKQRFTHFHTTFRTHPYYLGMMQVCENSKYHREETVAVHTEMVVQQYIDSSPHDEWDYYDYMGALACLFHDVGKPAAKTYCDKHKRFRFTDHETISTRMWEQYVVEHNSQQNIVEQPYDIYSVGWTIQNHLPYGVKKPVKLAKMKRTIHRTLGMEIFRRVVMSDQLGRIADDHDTHLQKVRQWFVTLEQTPDDVVTVSTDRPYMDILIGVSSSGKSSYTTNRFDDLDVTVFSWDQLRLAWFPHPTGTPVTELDRYNYAFQQSCVSSHKFYELASKALETLCRDQKNVVVDNMNLSEKRRREFLQMAKRFKYQVRYVLFPVTTNQLIERDISRENRSLGSDALINMYNKLQYPSYDDIVSDIFVMGSNM